MRFVCLSRCVNDGLCDYHTVHMEVAEKVCSYGVDESLLEETKNGVITCKLSEMKSYELPW